MTEHVAGVGYSREPEHVTFQCEVLALGHRPCLGRYGPATNPETGQGEMVDATGLEPVTPCV